LTVSFSVKNALSNSYQDLWFLLCSDFDSDCCLRGWYWSPLGMPCESKSSLFSSLVEKCSKSF
jgi:hypothetical protein